MALDVKTTTATKDLESFRYSEAHDRKRGRDADVVTDADAPLKRFAPSAASDDVDVDGRSPRSALERLVAEVSAPLNFTQRQALQWARDGTNLFVTGAGGVGKSFLVDVIRRVLEAERGAEAVAVVATTGVAALNVGGTTFHSFLRLGLAREPIAVILENIRVKGYHKVKAYMRRLRTLIVDEVSMLSVDFFEKADAVLRVFRNVAHKPFGGLQVIFVGDFYQLPPVDTSSSSSSSLSSAFAIKDTATTAAVGSSLSPETQAVLDRSAKIMAETDATLARLDGRAAPSATPSAAPSAPSASAPSAPPVFVFETELWRSMRIRVVELVEIFRQTDPVFVALLQRARKGALNESDVDFLRSRVGAELPDDGIEPTRLYALNRQVGRVNEEKLAMIRDQATYDFEPHEGAWSLEDLESHARDELGDYKGALPAAVVAGVAKKRPLPSSSSSSEDKKKMRPEHAADLAKKRSDMQRKLRDEIPVEARTSLKIGAQVMLCANLSPKDGFVNGSRGVVVGFATPRDDAMSRGFDDSDSDSESKREAPHASGGGAKGSRHVSASSSSSSSSSSSTNKFRGHVTVTKARVTAPLSASTSTDAPFQYTADDAFFLDRAPTSCLGTMNSLCPRVTALPVVRFANGKRIVVPLWRWTLDDAFAGMAYIWAVPLKLAYAVSIHKAQGLSLDRVSIDFRGMFEYNMAYVALSRARTPTMMSLESFDPRMVRANPRVLSAMP